MKLKLSAVAVAAACLCSLSGAQAQEWKFSGFGTVGLAHSTEEQADFVSSTTQSNGTGHSHSWTANTDSKLGGQVDLKLSPKWSGSAQVLSKYQFDSSYSPKFTLAFAKYAPMPGLEIRGGRLPYAAFVVSDYRSIGYSQPWVRPPLEVYGLSFDQVDGADVTWRTTVGDVGFKLQAMLGNSEQDQVAAKLRAKGLSGVNFAADFGEFNTRVSYINVRKLSLSSPGLDQVFGLVRSGVPAGGLYPGSPALPADPATADEHEIKDKRASYLSLGMTYDPGPWFITGEFGLMKRTGFNPQAHEFYVTSGARIKAFTPYLSLAQYKYTETLSSSNPIMQGVLAQAAVREQRTTSVGVRWDFAKSADFKVQYDRVDLRGQNTGFLVNQQAGYVPGKDYGVVSAVVDFVF